MSQASLARLSREERLRLLRFVASFAWADLTVRDEERAFLARLVRRMALEAEDVRQVAGWLAVPPSPDDVDPTEVPHVHRHLFVEAAREVVMADGEVAPEERAYLKLLEQLTR
ncbi:MAG TPA: TerB family tellurite resistance protein [Vicinamibacteria bacterium]|nr:TerB family tellurite resistance protein [Vicinamibacteria bacterium]